MSSNPNNASPHLLAIEANHLSKTYAIFSSPQDRLKQLLFRSRRKYYREFHALHDVSFSISKGETVGIVGRNGSGKSTLLQMLCGTLRPTSGSALVRGRIAALLELGAGFNPEFTGRENVFLNATILGMREAQIRERFHLIESFAAIGDFIDQPVKRYSSGMFARLAFAVAINVDPDILIVDEALSVGDEAFQRKCFSRIDELRDKGTTVLFVSHSAGAIIELCDRAILLHQGERLLTGSPRDVVSWYQRLSYAPPDKEASIVREIREEDAKLLHGSATSSHPLQVNSGSYSTIPEELHLASSPNYSLAAPALTGTDSAPVKDIAFSYTGEFDSFLTPQSTLAYHTQGAMIRDAGIYDRNGEQRNVLVPGQEYQFRYVVEFSHTASRVRFGMLLKTISGNELGGLTSHCTGEGITTVEPGESVSVSFGLVPRLSPGTYFLNAGVMGWVNDTETYLHRILDVLMFRVLPQTAQTVTGYVDFSSSICCEVKFKSS